MNRQIVAITLVSMFLAAVPAPAQEPTAQETFYRAFYLEEGLRKLDEAQKTYGQAALRALAAGDQELAVKAMLARAELLRKLRRPDEARPLLEKALELAPESEAVRLALEALAKPQEEGIAAEVARIVSQYYGPGQEEAAEKLERLGAQAVGPLLGQLEELEGAAPHVLRGVAKHLGTFGGEELVEPFARFLESADAASRVAAAQGILMNDRSDLVKLRLADVALKNSDPKVRDAAASGLSTGIWWFEPRELGEAFAASLARALAIDDYDLRKALLLSRWRQPESVWPLLAPTLLRLAGSEDWPMQQLALSAWGKWSAVAADQDDSELTRQVVSAITDAAMEALEHDDDRVRRRGATTLGELREWPERIRPRLLAAVRKGILKPDPRDWSGDYGSTMQRWMGPQGGTRSNIVADSFTASEILDLYALCGSSESRLDSGTAGMLRQTLAQRGLWSSARSKSEQEAIAAEGLRRIPDAEGLLGWLHSTRDLITDTDAMLQVMENEDPRVRKAAYAALIRASQRGHRPDPKTKPPQKMLEDLASKDPDLRSYARGASDHFHHPDLAPALRSYIARTVEQKAGRKWEQDVSIALGRLASLEGVDALPDIRAWLEEHPRSVVSRSLPELLGNEVIQAYLDLSMRGGDPRWFMHSLKDPEAKIAFITQLPPDRRRAVIEHAGSVLDAATLEGWLRPVFKNDHDGDRVDAALLAGKKHLVGLWPELLALLEDEDDDVRKHAKNALEEIRWYHDVKASLETFGPTGRAEALAEAKKLASSEDPVQRRGAAFALAALGDPAAVPALLELLKDADAAVREAAVEALQRLGAR